MRRRIAAVLCAPALLTGVALCRAGELKDYQLRRWFLEIGCRVMALERTAPNTFAAECADTLRFPDGARASCTDGDDERSCTLLTPPREFRFLPQ